MKPTAPRWDYSPQQASLTGHDSRKPVSLRTLNTPGKIRTCDLQIRNQLLYPLSYGRLTFLIALYYAPLSVLSQSAKNSLKKDNLATKLRIGPGFLKQLSQVRILPEILHFRSVT